MEIHHLYWLGSRPPRCLDLLLFMSNAVKDLIESYWTTDMTVDLYILRNHFHLKTFSWCNIDLNYQFKLIYVSISGDAAVVSHLFDLPHRLLVVDALSSVSSFSFKILNAWFLAGFLQHFFRQFTCACCMVYMFQTGSLKYCHRPILCSKSKWLVAICTWWASGFLLFFLSNILAFSVSTGFSCVLACQFWSDYVLYPCLVVIYVWQ